MPAFGTHPRWVVLRWTGRQCYQANSKLWRISVSTRCDARQAIVWFCQPAVPAGAQTIGDAASFASLLDLKPVGAVDVIQSCASHSPPISRRRRRRRRKRDGDAFLVLISYVRRFCGPPNTSLHAQAKRQGAATTRTAFSVPDMQRAVRAGVPFPRRGQRIREAIALTIATSRTAGPHDRWSASIRRCPTHAMAALPEQA